MRMCHSATMHQKQSASHIDDRDHETDEYGSHHIGATVSFVITPVLVVQHL
jgi:hypothetical protein